ncbi:hypothetical protein [Microlunatus speluncae]|uniref:hypothetical protein n=1 Tax=Microlunatus speluncae TaxID=2594267 RepID=UPI0012663EE6|nr:hypothetical protein [Microlunatus speluncae]
MIGIPVLALALFGALGVAVGGQVALQASFARVRHPESLATANLTADAETVRGWYQQLAAQGTLDQMIITETVDYLWMAGLAASLVLVTFLAAALVRRRHSKAAARLHRLAPAMIAAPALDAVENALSLIMLSDPVGFPDPLAYAHAGVSMIKVVAAIGSATVVPAYAVWALIRGGTGTDSGNER